MEYSKEKHLCCKINSAISHIYGTLTPSFMQKTPNHDPPLSLGLKTLIHPKQEQKSHVIHSYMLSPPKTPSQPSKSKTFSSLTNSSSFDLSSSSFSDEMIGTESGCCLGADFEPIEPKTAPYHHVKRDQRRREATQKQYPPPIPLLARRGNLPGYRPWKLTRQYVDGRLILTEERVKHDEYLEARRENGRLILDLVTFRDIEEEEEEEEIEEEIEEEEEEIGDEIEEEEEVVVPENAAAVRIPAESYMCCNNVNEFISPCCSPAMAAVVN